MRFAEFFRGELKLRPYLPGLAASWREATRTDSRLCRFIFGLLIVPVGLPLIAAVNILFGGILPGVGDFDLFDRVLAFQIIVEAGFIGYLFLAARDYGFAPYFTRTHLYLGAFGILLLGAVLLSPDPRAGILSTTSRADGLLFLAHLWIYILLISWIARDRKKIEYLFKTVVVLGIFTAAVVPLIYGLRGMLGLAAGFRQIEQIILGNTGFFAHYLLLVLLFNGYFLLTRPRAWNLAAAVFLIPLVFISGSSTAIGLLVLLCAIFLFFTARVWFYGAVLFGLFIWWYAVAIGDRYLDAIFFSPVAEEFVRGRIWKDTIAVVWHNSPWLGFGWGNVALMWNALAHDSWAASGYPWGPIFFDKIHNVFLRFFAAAGIFGAIALVLFWGRILVYTVRSAIVARGGVWLALFFAFAGHLAYLFFNFDAPASYMLAAILLAAYIHFADEPACMRQRDGNIFGLPAHFRVGAAAAVCVFLVYANILPLYAHSRVEQYQRSLTRQEIFEEAKFIARLEELKKIRLLPQPYKTIAEDTAQYLGEAAKYLPEKSAARELIISELRANYAELIMFHPQNPFYYYGLAQGEKNIAGNPAAAELQLKAAIALAPEKGIFRFQLAVIYLQQEKISAARTQLLLIKENGLYPGVVDIYLGIADFLEGKIDEGKKRFITALAMTPTLTANEWNMTTAAYLTHGTKAELIAWYERMRPFLRDKLAIEGLIDFLRTADGTDL